MLELRVLRTPPLCGSAQDDKLFVGAAVAYLGGWEEFGFVFWGEFFGFLFEFGFGVGVGFGWWGGSGFDGDSDLGEEVFLSGGGADAEEAGGLIGGVAELVRGVGGDVDGFAGLDGGLCAAEGRFDFADEDGEGFFEVVAVWGRASAGRDVHVDEAVFSGGVFGGEEDGVGVSDEADVGEGCRGWRG